jgi:extracellular matrix regulatory protein A
MGVELLHIGFGSVVAVSRVLAIMAPDSSPIRRMLQEARSANRLIDLTYGRRTKSVLVLDSGHLILAPIHPETMAGRLGRQRGGEE